jgi:hypothetical protein
MSVARKWSRGIVSLGALVLVCGLLTAGVAWANGEEFFGDKDMVLDTYFFGHIKDPGGKVLDNAVVTVRARDLDMKFPFRNDAPGHFRSPDIGRAVKGLGKQLDLAQIEIEVAKKGYVLAGPIRLPKKTKGAIGPIEIVLAPAPSSAN